MKNASTNEIIAYATGAVFLLLLAACTTVTPNTGANPQAGGQEGSTAIEAPAGASGEIAGQAAALPPEQEIESSLVVDSQLEEVEIGEMY